MLEALDKGLQREMGSTKDPGDNYGAVFLFLEIK